MDQDRNSHGNFAPKNTDQYNTLKFLKHKAKELKDLRLIVNECLSNGAYSDGNMEQQFNKFDAKNVPQWEQDIILEAYAVRKKKAIVLLKNLELYLKTEDQK